MSLAYKSFSIFKRDAILYITNIITGIIVARTLGPEGLGIFIILNTLISYSEAIGRIKVDVASVYFFAKGKYKDQDILSSINIIAIFSSFVLIGFMLIGFDELYSFLFKKISGDYNLHLISFLIFIPLHFLSMNYSYYHIAKENVEIYNNKLMVQAWSNSLIAILLLIFSDLKIWAVIIAQILSTVFSLFYGYIKINKNGWKHSQKINSRLIKEILKYGYNFYLSGIIGHIHEYGVRAISISFLSVSQISFLGQAQNLGQLLHKIPNSISTILYSRLSRIDEDVLSASIVKKAFKLSLILILFISILLILVIEDLIIFLYGIEFQETSRIMKIILPGVIVYSLNSIFITYFNGTGRARIVPKVAIFPVCFQMILAYFMIDKWSINGAAIAYSMGFVIYSIFMIITFVKISNSKLSEIIPRADDLRQLFFILITIIKPKPK